MLGSVLEGTRALRLTREERVVELRALLARRRVLFRPSGQGQAARWEVVRDVRALAALSGFGQLPPPGRFLRLVHIPTGREECWPVEVVHERRAGKPDAGAWVITPAHAGLAHSGLAEAGMTHADMERSA